MTTPALVWSGTYQGTPTPSGGYSFRRSFWQGKNRYDWHDSEIASRCIARYISWDTAKKDGEDNDWTAYTVGELMPDYRLNIRHVFQSRLQFPDLTSAIESAALTWNRDGKLKAVVIEDKSSGTSALQTLRRSADAWLQALLIGFMPTTDKVTRFGQAAVWCNNGCVQMPYLERDLIWLAEFEEQLFTVPQSKFDDMADSFTQLILYIENILEHGYHARKQAVKDEIE